MAGVVFSLPRVATSTEQQHDLDSKQHGPERLSILGFVVFARGCSRDASGFEDRGLDECDGGVDRIGATGRVHGFECDLI